MKNSQKVEIEPSFNKHYDFHKLREEYGEYIRTINRTVKKNSHGFLNELSKTDDLFPNYNRLPKNFKLMERLSNLRGKFLTTQDLVEPFPYIEMGDLAHRLIYYDKSMIHKEEMELIHIYKNKNEAGPMESYEFGKIILGYKVHENLLENKPTYALQAIVDNLSSSVKSCHPECSQLAR